MKNLSFCESLVTVDGYFENWSEWSSCLQTCGPGYRTRSRACIPPKNGGAPCSQNNRETQQCVLMHCPGMCSLYFTLFVNFTKIAFWNDLYRQVLLRIVCFNSHAENLQRGEIVYLIRIFQNCYCSQSNLHTHDWKPVKEIWLIWNFIEMSKKTHLHFVHRYNLSLNRFLLQTIIWFTK